MTFFCVNCFAELSAEGGRCPRCGAAQNLDRRDYAAKLRSALAHPMVETRRRAIFLMGEKRLAEGVDELIEILERETDPFLVEESVGALGKIRSEKTLSALTRAACHKSFLVRARAIRALVSAGGRWARIATEIAASDPSPSVRAVAQSNSLKTRRLS